VLDKKAAEADKQAEGTRKKFQKGGMGTNDFLNAYLEERKEFHRMQITKIKVRQS